MSRHKRHIEYKEFCFGKDVSPEWFLNAVKQMEVEYIIERGKVRGCRFYKHGKEITKAIGDRIRISDIYE